MKAIIAVVLGLIITTCVKSADENMATIKQREEAIMKEQKEAVLSLAQIAESKTLFGQVLGYIDRIRLVKIGDRASLVEVALGTPSYISKDGDDWFYGSKTCYACLTFKDKALQRIEFHVPSF